MTIKQINEKKKNRSMKPETDSLKRSTKLKNL